MAFFKPKVSDPRDQSVRPTRTITGGPVTLSEEVNGGLERRARLFGSAVRILQNHPLTSPTSLGVPLGDGHGLEELVSAIRPIFANEKSMIRWVALRGALLPLDMLFQGEEERSTFLPLMGLIESNKYESRVKVNDPEGSISDDVRENILGVYNSVIAKLSIYDQISKMSMDEVNSATNFKNFSDSVALDVIAWSATAIIRTPFERIELSIVAWPEPGMLEMPGWYADPLWGKCERFWDGSDWTSRVRGRDSQHRLWEQEAPLR